MLLFSPRGLQEGADPRVHMHRFRQQCTQSEVKQTVWKLVLLRPTLKVAGWAVWAGWAGLSCHLPGGSQEWSSVWAASSSLPFSFIFVLRFPSGWDRACLALLHTAREQHVPSPVAFKCLPESHLWAQVVFPNSKVAEDSHFTTSRTGILRYQISAITKCNSNKREAGRYFRQNTQCSN